MFAKIGQQNDTCKGLSYSVHYAEEREKETEIKTEIEIKGK